MSRTSFHDHGLFAGKIFQDHEAHWSMQRESDICFIVGGHTPILLQRLLAALVTMYRNQIVTCRSRGSKARDLMFILRQAYEQQSILPNPADAGHDDAALRVKLDHVEGEVALVQEYLTASVIGMARDRGGQIGALLGQTNTLQSEAALFKRTTEEFRRRSFWQRWKWRVLINLLLLLCLLGGLIEACGLTMNDCRPRILLPSHKTN
eukprot:Blabericola_migrator_1__3571@NODE_2061_length_3346_cov_124_000305_g1306_i0_p3_GENE_NODE_2061_length_3346_cov_124_000305_g1306_i0NODE_2061_length_3346_cov_124_000305_g1306_i0_p3_ORF_typecomplete_len207_score10_62Synaptobrevin/PF00957_21/5_4e08DUF1294/PF06961_13/2_5e02DUF1294/PF06961_13/1_5_NODE_2061_length_3346_cov_124_000305_g1306_i015922212